MSYFSIPKPSQELMERVSSLVQQEQQCTREIVFKLGEIEAHSGHLQAGYSSLFGYCTIELGYSDDAAMRRIKAARCLYRHPRGKELLMEGKLNLSTICLLAGVINTNNADELFERAAGKPKSVVQDIVAAIRPTPNLNCRDDVRPFFVEKPSQAQKNLEFEPRGQVDNEFERLLPELADLPQREKRLRINFTASAEFEKKLERMEQLLRGKYWRPSFEQVFTEAMDCYFKHNCPVEKAVRKQERLKKSQEPQTKKAAVVKVNDGKHSRYIPSEIYLQVYLRDQGRCTYVAPDGRRCDSMQCEVDHIEPFALGGASDDPENLRLLCKAHNMLEAERVYGKEHMDQFRRCA